MTAPSHAAASDSTVVGIKVADATDRAVSRVEELRVTVVPAAPPPAEATKELTGTQTPATPPPPPPTPTRDGDLRVRLTPSVIAVTPGRSVAVDVLIFNATDVVDEFVVEAVGFDDAWLTVTPERTSLFPSTDATTRVSLTVPPDAQLAAGDHTVGLKVSSTSNPGLARVEELRLSVQAVGAGVMMLEPQTVRGGGRASLTARVTNNGNVPLAVTFRGDDAERAISFRFNPPNLQIPPYGTASSSIRLRADRRWAGQTTPRAFDVRAETGAEPIVARGTFNQRPRLSPMVMRIAGVLMSLGLVAAIAMAIPSTRNLIFPGPTTTTLPPTAAVINSFAPTGDGTTTDGCVTLAWDVDEAVEVTLETPQRQARVEPQASDDVCGATGDTITLRAVGTDGVAKTATYALNVALTLGDVQAEIRGRTVIFDVDTNQTADVTIALVGRAVDKTSTGKNRHHLEFDGEESGTIEWRATASLAGQADIVKGGTIEMPYYSLRVTMVGEPTFTATPPPPNPDPGGVTGDVSIFQTVTIPIFELAPFVFDPTIMPVSYWVGFAAQPVPRFLGENCPVKYTDQATDALILPLEDDGSAEVVLGIDLCTDLGFTQPLPEDPATSQTLKIAPGFDELTGEKEFVFPANDGSVTMVVRVERITTPDRPEYP